MKPTMKRYFLLFAISASATRAFGTDPEVKNVYVAPDGNEVRIEVDLTRPVEPIIREVSNPSRLILEFPNASFRHTEYLGINRNGVRALRTGVSPANPASTRIVVGIDSARPYAIQSVGNKFVLTILPHPVRTTIPPEVASSSPTDAKADEPRAAEGPPISPAAVKPELQVTNADLDSVLEEPDAVSSVTARLSFKVKYIAGNTIYINGGANSGLRPGMKLEIYEKPSAPAAADHNRGPAVASVRVVGLAATSAITEVNAGDGAVKAGDFAELDPEDAADAARNAQTANQSALPNLHLPDRDVSESSGAAANVPSSSFRSSTKQEPQSGTRMAGRIGFDYSSITSTGSTPGTSTQRGISFQSDMTNILGTHWNLQGYWRGRINEHSQFNEPTIEESLNKTYTMQLYYANPSSKWVAGVGRLYLPWAVSLDTIDGGYVGRKWPLGMTTGIFAGSTPDLNSWHYRPNQRIGGAFVNFTGGGYDHFHFSSTTGVGVNTIGWKVDRPFAFFENEASYKSVLSVYHSLIVDQLRGVSTDGLRLGTGVSHSYFTAHYIPNRMVSFDLYHNYFRDVPTATTTIVGTGLVDKLLFQGLSAGVHLKPVRNVALYSTLGASEKTGDSHRSLNQMYGASWSEIARSGLRADLHYSRFDSNFGSGNYKVFSLSRQVTNRAFWNVQVGKQTLLSTYTTNHNSIYVDDSLDVNIGRRTYLQSGYTYVNGATLNYRQLYFSWGFRFNRGKSSPEYVETQPPVR